MIHTKPVIPSIFTCSLLIRCVLLLLESTEKRSILLPPYCELSKESTSGSINRSVFFWLTSLFIGGYQRVLSLGDLCPLDPQLQCQKLQERFNPAWTMVGTGIYLLYQKDFRIDSSLKCMTRLVRTLCSRRGSQSNFGK